ncbi:DUF429 domain-containing protein [Thiohalomonas denitrificans]|uniref:DUF429 domain-containing protein n=1 Tax=Thiohalomonas denitrificans TaxID=415747 RepID=UPI0026F1807D|nr:DUF429 domain-containing protein [Thiohalomonas denitrificans]
MTALLGIDCATQPKKVGLALGELRKGRVCILECCIGSATASPVDIAADWLANVESALIALDAPLGWPISLATALADHRAGSGMRAPADDLFRRLTDIEIRRRLGKKPLEVGANLISRTTVAALELLEGIRAKTGLPVSLAWAPDEPEPIRTIEVYPAATRLAHSAQSGGGSVEGLMRVLDRSGFTLEGVGPDAMDAAVCALGAADFLGGRAVGPESSDMQRVLVEGWIWSADRPSVN